MPHADGNHLNDWRSLPCEWLGLVARSRPRTSGGVPLVFAISRADQGINRPNFVGSLGPFLCVRRTRERNIHSADANVNLP